MQFFLDSEHMELRLIFDIYLGKSMMGVLKVNGNKKNKMYINCSLKNEVKNFFSSLHYRFYNPLTS